LKIVVNGQTHETQAAHMEALLKDFNLLPTQVALEHNGVVLFRHEFSKITPKEGDRIEIVKVVAGG
jgi:thiamine biosynthesis protein ThiS